METKTIKELAAEMAARRNMERRRDERRAAIARVNADQERYNAQGFRSSLARSGKV